MASPIGEHDIQIVSVSIPMKSICPVGKAHWDHHSNNMIDVTMREEFWRLT